MFCSSSILPITSPKITKANLFSLPGAWTSWTPTLSGGWNVTGNAILTCRYNQIGKLVTASFSFTSGSTTTYQSGNLTFSLPVPAIDISALFIGPAYLEDAGTQAYPGNFWFANTTTGQIVFHEVVGSAVCRSLVTNTAPFTWAAGDKIQGTLVYEAA